MNPRLIILAAALALAIAAIIHLKRTAASLAAGMAGDPPGNTEVPTKTPRITGERWQRIYPALNADLLAIAVDLHRHLANWINDNAEKGSGSFTERAFLPFGLKTTANLETTDIVALIKWLESPSSLSKTGPHIRAYLPALYFQWGSRAPDEARTHLLTRLKAALASGRSFEEA